MIVATQMSVSLFMTVSSVSCPVYAPLLPHTFLDIVLFFCKNDQQVGMQVAVV